MKLEERLNTALAGRFIESVEVEGEDIILRLDDGPAVITHGIRFLYPLDEEEDAAIW